ncbi:hypothetical protein AVEN_237596-1 [Araneus ventricosus]|uniref:RNase H type-1 domain-containing protein n=1 Tax=Araneus ventricosus TaxID=182803 RepID=A0A4Y2V3S8_ARAVE|nr:hypothetical protein AVEN_237596-1 [Araneus ventricosus]
MTTLYRLRKQLNDIIIQPEDLEQRKVGWSNHPSRYLCPVQLILEDDGNSINQLRICTDGSKSPNGVGVAFRVWDGKELIHKWPVKLGNYNTIYQAELLALKEAVYYASHLSSNQIIKIFTHNKASIQSSADPKTPSPMARQISESLVDNSHIEMQCIKAHVGYVGNKAVDPTGQRSSSL